MVVNFYGEMEYWYIFCIFVFSSFSVLWCGGGVVWCVVVWWCGVVWCGPCVSLFYFLSLSLSLFPSLFVCVSVCCSSLSLHAGMSYTLQGNKENLLGGK